MSPETAARSAYPAGRSYAVRTFGADSPRAPADQQVVYAVAVKIPKVNIVDFPALALDVLPLLPLAVRLFLEHGDIRRVRIRAGFRLVEDDNFVFAVAVQIRENNGLAQVRLPAFRGSHT